MSDLYWTALNAGNGDKHEKKEIIRKFNPLIKMYTKKLAYDGAETDMIIDLLEIIDKYPFHRDEISESNFLAYVAVSMKNKYIKLSKKHGEILNNEVELTEGVYKDTSINSDPENATIFKLLLEELTVHQRKVIEDLYLNGYSEKELAAKYNVSHQAINKIKWKALQKLKELIS